MEAILGIVVGGVLGGGLSIVSAWVQHRFDRRARDEDREAERVARREEREAASEQREQERTERAVERARDACMRALQIAIEYSAAASIGADFNARFSAARAELELYAPKSVRDAFADYIGAIEREEVLSRDEPPDEYSTVLDNKTEMFAEAIRQFLALADAAAQVALVRNGSRQLAPRDAR